MRRAVRGGGGALRRCRCFSTSAAAPERILVIGGGVSGLSVAYFLQHLRPSHHRPPPLIHLVDSSYRLGGWIHTTRVSAPSTRGPPFDFLFERGPRSLLTRRGDSTLALLQSLGLHRDVLLSDATAKRRFLWDGHRRRLAMLPTGLNASLLSFPHLSPVLSALLNEWRQPRRTAASAPRGLGCGRRVDLRLRMPALQSRGGGGAARPAGGRHLLGRHSPAQRRQLLRRPPLRRGGARRGPALSPQPQTGGEGGGGRGAHAGRGGAGQRGLGARCQGQWHLQLPPRDGDAAQSPGPGHHRTSRVHLVPRRPTLHPAPVHHCPAADVQRRRRHSGRRRAGGAV